MNKAEQKRYALDKWPHKYMTYGINYCATTFLNCKKPCDLKTDWNLVGDFATSEHIGLGKAEIEFQDIDEY